MYFETPEGVSWTDFAAKCANFPANSDAWNSVAAFAGRKLASTGSNFSYIIVALYVHLTNISHREVVLPGVQKRLSFFWIQSWPFIYFSVRHQSTRSAVINQRFACKVLTKWIRCMQRRNFCRALIKRRIYLYAVKNVAIKPALTCCSRHRSEDGVVWSGGCCYCMNPGHTPSYGVILKVKQKKGPSEGTFGSQWQAINSSCCKKCEKPKH